MIFFISKIKNHKNHWEKLNIKDFLLYLLQHSSLCELIEFFLRVLN